MKPYPTYRRMARKGKSIMRFTIDKQAYDCAREIAKRMNCSVPYLLQDAFLRKMGVSNQ